MERIIPKKGEPIVIRMGTRPLRVDLTSTCTPTNVGECLIRGRKLQGLSSPLDMLWIDMKDGSIVSFDPTPIFREKQNGS